MDGSRPAKAALFLLILTASCTRAARAPISGAAGPPPRPEFARCAIPASAWTAPIVVEPGAGAPSIAVGAEHARLLPDEHGAWEAVVDAPLSFRGTTEEPDLATARVVENGTLLHLEAGRRVRSVRSEASVLVGQAWLTSDRDPSAPLSILVDPVRFACADLRAVDLDDEPEPRQRPVDLWSPVQVADLGFLEVGDATRAEGARIVARGDGLFAHVLERAGDRARVVLQFSDGSRLRGWVDATSLRDPEPEETLRIGRAMGGLAELDVGAAVPLSAWVPPPGARAWGYGAFGGIGRRVRAASEPPRPIDARIVRGTPVFAAPGRGRWAVVTEEVIFGVWARPSCAWVAIQRAPRLDLPPLRAWVRAEALRIVAGSP